MKRDQFIRKLRKYCKNRQLSFEWIAGEGKGSHGAVYVGGRRTIIPNKDLPDFYIDEVLKQLGLPRDYFRQLNG